MNDANRITETLAAAVRQVYGRADGLIPLHAPSFKGREWDYVKDCLDTGWVSSVGQYVDRFEQSLVQYTGSPYAVATVNGTAAIHVALLLSGVQAGDEVLCPAFTFVATISAIMYCGAHPVFMDSDPHTLGMDVGKVTRFLRERGVKHGDGFATNRHSGRRIAACIPMHAYGYPVQIEPLVEVCSEYRIPVVEDAAEALGSSCKGKHCGTFGRFGILSFNGNKIMTTGGGGAILCKEAEQAKRAKHLTTTAKIDHPWDYVHNAVGYNYRLPNLNAALGCAQLEGLEGMLLRKRRQAEEFKRVLIGEKDIDVVQPESRGVNHWFNLVRIPSAHREEILKELNAQGIQSRAAWTPVCDMPPYRTYETFEMKAARELYLSLICLPNGLID
jgi:perosamine synthetase